MRHVFVVNFSNERSDTVAGHCHGSKARCIVSPLPWILGFFSVTSEVLILRALILTCIVTHHPLTTEWWRCVVSTLMTVWWALWWRCCEHSGDGVWWALWWRCGEHAGFWPTLPLPDSWWRVDVTPPGIPMHRRRDKATGACCWDLHSYCVCSISF